MTSAYAPLARADTSHVPPQHVCRFDLRVPYRAAAGLRIAS
ncbi:hypothetical protein [Burkholderia ubonensis]|nr:hypothetical protein [Burkholderia ubonensis]